jgi:TonB family protein
MKFVLILALLFSATGKLTPESVVAVQDSGEQYQSGIALYEKGDFKEAATLLQAAAKQDKSNVTVWHYLGLALEGLGKLNDARKAHEKAARLGEADLLLQLGTPSARNYLLILNPIRSQLQYAATSAAKYRQLSPKLSKSKDWEWADRADLLADFAELASGGQSTDRLGEVILSKDATVRARILSKPEPQYTEEARQNKITGSVVLRAILGMDGKVHAIHPIKSLPAGLTSQAVSVARQIKFIPAMKADHPVSVFVQLEYHFNLY